MSFDDPQAETSDTGEMEHSRKEFENHVFVVPLDAPLPLELQQVPLAEGGLLDRLRPLGVELTDGTVALLPISGSELQSLERAWSRLQVAKRVVVLDELPGAKYDVLFTQARRQIGLKVLPWPFIADALAASQREFQRVTDTAGWEQSEKPALARPKGPNLSKANSMLEEPQDFEDES